MVASKWMIGAALLFSAATSAVAQERQWLLDAADQDVFLVFGVPDSNDVGVSFWCRIGKPDITLFLPMPQNAKAPAPELLIDIAGKTFKTTGMLPEEENGKTVEAKLPEREAAMTALKDTDRFSITIENHKAVYPLAGADFEGFLKLCSAMPDVEN
jgi:hypothetical protein